MILIRIEHGLVKGHSIGGIGHVDVSRIGTEW